MSMTLTAGVWNLLSGDGADDDEYVLKKGDTMTGALTMDTADHIHMVNTDLDFQATMDDDGSNTWDPAVDRFLDVESMVPQIVAADGTKNADYSDSFGINFKINAGNTGKNRLKVSNRYGDIVTFKGGTGPQLVFSDYEDPSQGGFTPPADSGLTQGIPIRGIATPDHDNSPDDIAVNKEYVDGRDHILQEEIIILQEEILALTTIRDRGVWKDAATNIPPEGHFSMRRGGGQVTADYTQTDINFVVIHKTSFDGHVATFASAQIGDTIQLLDIRDGHFGLFEIKAKDDQSSNDYVSFEVQHLEGLGSTQPEDEVIIRIFEPPSGGTASEFVKKIGDTMTGNLEIKKNPNTTDEGAAALTLKGRRSNATDSSATIAFSNENVTESSRIGYLTYRSYDTSQSFKFNKNVTTTGSFRADYDITTGAYLKGINRTNNTYRSQNINLGTTLAGYLNWDTHTRLEWGSSGGVLRGGANDAQTMLTWDGDGGMARFQNSRRIVWNSAGGSLHVGDATEVLKWTSQGVDQLRLNSRTGSTGQVPTKTASGIEWATPTGGGAQVLNDLDDVNANGVQDGSLLVYSEAESAWVPVVQAGEPTSALKQIESDLIKDFAGSGLEDDPYVWESNNKGQHNTEAYNRFSVLADCKLYYKFNISSESSDRFYIFINGNQHFRGDGLSTNAGKDYEGSFDVQKDDVVQFEYRKDGSVNNNLDRLLCLYLYSDTTVSGPAAGSVITQTLPLHVQMTINRTSSTSSINDSNFWTFDGDSTTYNSWNAVFMPKAKIRSLMDLPASATTLKCLDFSGTWFNTDNPSSYSRVSNRGELKTVNGIEGILVKFTSTSSISNSYRNVIINLPNAIYAQFRMEDTLGDL